MRILSSVFTAALAFKSGKNIANGNCDDLSLENEPICTDGCDGALTQCFMMCDPALVPWRDWNHNMIILWTSTSNSEKGFNGYFSDNLCSRNCFDLHETCRNGCPCHTDCFNGCSQCPDKCDICDIDVEAVSF